MWKAIKKSIPWLLFTIIYWYEELIFNLFTEKSLGIWTVVVSPYYWRRGSATCISLSKKGS